MFLIPPMNNRPIEYSNTTRAKRRRAGLSKLEQSGGSQDTRATAQPRGKQ